jgi:hypothetical protein
LFFRGVGPAADGKLRSGRAERTPLPDKLAGLEVRIEQSRPPAALRLPLISVRQETECGETQSATAACLLTSVQAQIPFELSIAPAAGEGAGRPPLARLVLWEDGRPGAAAPVQPVSIHAHVVTSCDLNWDTKPASVCSRTAYRADGRPADRNRPVSRGDSIVIYAYGLGPVFPPAETGKPSPEGAEVAMSGVRRIWASLRDQPVNASASLAPFFDPAAADPSSTAIEWAGLTPGQTGLYQLNIRVPETFEPKLPCGPEVSSNAVAWVTTALGSELVPFCVAP